jgi:hypothetical protein
MPKASLDNKCSCELAAMVLSPDDDDPFNRLNMRVMRRPTRTTSSPKRLGVVLS